MRKMILLPIIVILIITIVAAILLYWPSDYKFVFEGEEVQVRNYHKDILENIESFSFSMITNADEEFDTNNALF